MQSKWRQHIPLIVPKISLTSVYSIYACQNLKYYFNFTTPHLALQEKRKATENTKIVREKNYFCALLHGHFCCFLLI
jgi:hypothetical protein